ADRSQRGLRGGGYLADVVLPLATPAQSLWYRRLASAAAAGAARASSAAAAPGRTAPACRRDPRSDLGRAAAGGPRPTAVAGAGGLAAYAQGLGGRGVAASRVRRLLRRHGLPTRRQRLLVLEHHSARDAGLLTQRTRQLLWRLRHGQTRHVEAERPGELLCLDTFYIGKLKGVGKVWQVTACDVPSSYGGAPVLAQPSAAAPPAPLPTALLPAVP